MQQFSVAATLFSVILMRTIQSARLNDLRRSPTSGYSSQSSSAQIGPPAPPPIPPVPMMGDPGANMARAPPEPPFGPPGPPQYFGGDMNMPSSDGSMSSAAFGLPSPQQDVLAVSQYYPRSQPNPPARNDEPYAYPSGYGQARPVGLYNQGPVQNLDPSQISNQIVSGNPIPQLTLGGFPYSKPAPHTSFDSFAPIAVTPPNTPEYSYDWSFNSPMNQKSSNSLLPEAALSKDDVGLTIRDLLATPSPKVLPPPKFVTKRCVPDAVPGSSGLCAGRAFRRAKCGGLVSSASKDCTGDELCCFAIRKNTTVVSLTVKESQRKCFSSVSPSSQGFCTVRAERQRNCAGLMAGASSDCLNGQLCCFSGARNRVSQIAGPQKLAVPTETFCMPSVKPTARGTCRKRQERLQKCVGMLSSASPNCRQDELCCFFLNGTLTKKQAISIQDVQNYVYGVANNGSYYSAPAPSTSPSTYATPSAYSTPSTTTKTTTRTTTSTVTYAPNWNPGSMTTPYYLPYKPDRLCVPATNPDVYDGVCVAGTMIQYLCSGLQAGTSLNCGYSEYCCYSNKSPPPVTYGYGCIPDNNPNIADGFCAEADDLASKCGGISISTSRTCAVTQFCCYNNKGVVTTTTGYYIPTANQSCTPSNNPSVRNGTCINGGQNGKECTGVTATSSNCRSDQLCCYTSPTTNITTPVKRCVPEADKDVKNGTCVDFTQISHQCKAIQVSTSLDCGYSQYCCYNHLPYTLPPTGKECVPENNPDVTNGNCVDAAELTARCAGQQISISASCPQTSLCCYGGRATTPTTPTTPATPTTPTTSTTPTAVPTYTTPMTTSSSYLYATPPPTVTSTTYASIVKPMSSTGQQVYTTVQETEMPLPSGCTPDLNPTVSNGRCVDADQLALSCAGIQIASSHGCPATTFCCYSASGLTVSATMQSTYTVPLTTTPRRSSASPVTSITSAYSAVTTATQSRPCVPDTNPLIKNGVCVDSSDLTTICMGISIATSRSCGSPGLCCFNSSSVVQPDGTTTAGYSYTVPYTDETTTAKRTTKTTVSRPTTGYYSYKPSGSPYTTTAAPTANRTCSPQNNRQIRNGVCVANNDISRRCSGIQISPSLDCMGEEYCCYQSPDIMDIRPGGACIPQTKPQILNGVCVDQDQLNISCRGVQMSVSRNCRSTQFCCYNTNDAYSWGYGYQTPTQAKAKRPRGSCQPNGRSQDSSLNGICVETGDVMAACNRWQVARSDDCQSSQYCCFSEDGEAVKRLGNQAEPPRLPNRDTFRLATAAQAQGQSYYGGYVYNTPSAPTPVTSSTPMSTPTSVTPSSTPLSTSTNTPVYTTPGPSRSCRPMSYPSSTGICVASAQIGQACREIQVSPSLNCYGSELCCFTSPTVVTPAPNTGGCIPEGSPAARGQCVDSDSISSVCAGNQMSNSRDCRTDQFCCFGGNGSVTATSTTVRPTTVNSSPTYSSTISSTTTTPSTTPTTLTTLTTKVTSVTTTTPISITPDGTTVLSFIGICRPDTMPIITNGTCVAQDLLSTDCRGIQISTSPYCPSGYFCCFNMVGGGPVTTTYATPSTIDTTTTSTTTPATTITRSTSTTTPTTSTTSTTTTSSTIPSSTVPYWYTTSTATNNRACFPQGDAGQQGLCVSASQISVACDGLQASSAAQCNSNEFCCYKPKAVVSTTEAAGGYCVPENDPSVINGTCVGTNDLARKCAGILVSVSYNCASDQLCCYDRYRGDTVALGYVSRDYE